MPSVCPKCFSKEIERLSMTMKASGLDYMRCGNCHHIWTVHRTQR
jgi:formate dehydrogenase maturation protein FdhE